MASKIRDRIINQAVRSFADNGYCGTSTKDIAARADVTEGSLFRLFGCKEKLFAESIARVKSATLPAERFEELLKADDIEAALTVALTEVFRRVSSDALRLNRVAMLESPKISGALIRPVYDSRIKAIAKRLRVGIACGRVSRDVNPRVAAEWIYLAVLNFHCEGLFLNRPKKKQLAFAGQFIHILLHGILK